MVSLLPYWQRLRSWLQLPLYTILKRRALKRRILNPTEDQVADIYTQRHGVVPMPVFPTSGHLALTHGGRVMVTRTLEQLRNYMDNECHLEYKKEYYIVVSPTACEWESRVRRPLPDASYIQNPEVVTFQCPACHKKQRQKGHGRSSKTGHWNTVCCVRCKFVYAPFQQIQLGICLTGWNSEELVAKALLMSPKHE